LEENIANQCNFYAPNQWVERWFAMIISMDMTKVVATFLCLGALSCGGTQKPSEPVGNLRKLAGVWHGVDLDGKYQLEIETTGEFLQVVTPIGGDPCEQRGRMYWYRGEKRSPSKLPDAGPDAPILVPMPPERALWVDVETNSCNATAIGSRLEVLPAGGVDERLPLHVERMGLTAPRNYRRFD
jgi:hypothetical protein